MVQSKKRKMLEADDGKDARPMKRFRTGYNWYTCKRFQEDKDDKKSMMIVKQKKYSEEWKKMTDEEKQPYLLKEKESILEFMGEDYGKINPNQIKRPMNPYMLFGIEKRPELKVKFPSLANNLVELNRMIAHEWKAMNMQEKQPFILRFQAEQDQYYKALDVIDPKRKKRTLTGIYCKRQEEEAKKEEESDD